VSRERQGIAGRLRARDGRTRAHAALLRDRTRSPTWTGGEEFHSAYRESGGRGKISR